MPGRNGDQHDAGLFASYLCCPKPNLTISGSFLSPHKITPVKYSFQCNFLPHFCPVQTSASTSHASWGLEKSSACSQRVLLVHKLLSVAPRLGWQLPTSGYQPPSKPFPSFEWNGVQPPALLLE